MRRTIRAEAFLARLPLFDGLPPDVLARLSAATTRRELRRGEVLFREGEDPAGFYVVVHGRVALTAGRGKARERVAEIVGAGRSFGEPIMFLEKPYIVGARALTDCLVLHVAKDAVFADLERNPPLARRMIAGLSAKLHATAQEAEVNALGTGSERLAAWLLKSLPAAKGAAVVTLPAAKKIVASRLNLSAEHLSRILGQLSAAGLIRVRGRNVEIPDTARLRDWTEGVRPLFRRSAGGRSPGRGWSGR